MDLRAVAVPAGLAGGSHDPAISAPWQAATDSPDSDRASLSDLAVPQAVAGPRYASRSLRPQQQRAAAAGFRQ
jgi:hypothetical protein